jgi:hypothetical protein
MELRDQPVSMELRDQPVSMELRDQPALMVLRVQLDQQVLRDQPVSMVLRDQPVSMVLRDPLRLEIPVNSFILFLPESPDQQRTFYIPVMETCLSGSLQLLQIYTFREMRVLSIYPFPTCQ